MTTRRDRMRRRAAVLAVAAMAVVALGGTALAGHQTSGVKSYTGCLVPGDGVIIKVKEGNAPKSACAGGQTEAHFSGGDITKISVGSGLSLPNGGDNGEVRIELAAGQVLPQGCAAGRVAEWNGSAWACGVDNDTTYSKGTGLDLSASNVFSIDEAHQVKNDPDCAAGQFATGFTSTGTIQCAPAQTGSHIYVTRDDFADAPQLPPGDSADIVSLVSLPAGSYMVTFTATAHDDAGGDGEAHVSCLMSGGGIIAWTQADHDEGIGGQTLAIAEAASFSSTNGIGVSCDSSEGSDHLKNIRLTAMKADGLTVK